MSDQPRNVPPGEPSDEARPTARSGRFDSERSVGRRERIASAVLGGTLLAFGLGRRSVGGAATALAGGWLAYRGLTGRNRPARMRGLDDVMGREEDRAAEPAGPSEVEKSVTVLKPADELVRYWRDPEQLTRIVGPLAEVTSASEDRQHWVVHGPLDQTVEWDVDVAEERPDELLRWESVEGAGVSLEASVEFRPAPADRGTEATLRLRFDPPGGAVGDAAMALAGVTLDVFASKALWRFKSLAETGEIPTLERNPSARGSGDLL